MLRKLARGGLITEPIHAFNGAVTKMLRKYENDKLLMHITYLLQWGRNKNATEIANNFASYRQNRNPSMGP